MSNLQIKTMLVIFQTLLLIIQALIYTYGSRTKEIKAEKFIRLTMHIITSVSFFIAGVVIALQCKL